MATVSLTTLVARVRERADMVGSSFVTDTDNGLYAWINEAHQKLHGMLVDAMGEEYVSSVVALQAVTSGSPDYLLPTDFFKLYGVELNIGGEVVTLEPYMRAERNGFRNAYRAGFDKPRYALIGSRLRLYPTPATSYVGSILYAPEATLLSVSLPFSYGSVNYPNGWERFIVIDAAIQCLAKEESNVAALVAERASIIREIELTKEMRDLAAPKQVVDVSVLDTNTEDWW